MLPVFFPEGFQPVVLHALDQLIGEGFAGNVENLHVRMILPDLVADGVHQMGLAQSGIAEQEEGVVGEGRIVGHGHGRRLGKPVGIPHHEIVKGVAGRKVGDKGLLGKGGRGFLLRRGSGRRFFRFRCRFLFRKQVQFHHFFSGHDKPPFSRG